MLKTAVPTKRPKLSVYLPPELKERLEKLAKVRKRSVNNMIEVLIEEAVNKAERDGELE